ncbi:GNAT family N-acetyltransferase [Helicobacter aurati]|nr:GNAT family N-acetyltransferase [Helicobacter aurati]
MLLRLMTIHDYEEIILLWKSIQGFYIREIDDSKEGINKFLLRNPHTNVVAIEDDKIVGTILCGYDGRCAYFYHVCVKQEYRHKRIGMSMVEFCINALKKEGATHINLIAFKTNNIGNLFWQELGWDNKDNVNLYEYILNTHNKKQMTN